MEKLQSSLRAYRWFIRLISPYLFAYTLWRTFQDGDKRYFWQRLGCMYSVEHERPIWLHCASVGEVMAAVPLVHAINRSYPKLAIVITTATPTGAAIAASRLPDTVTHLYLPLDWINATKQFVNAISPRLGIIMETELWPNLYATCKQLSIPLVIVNGRLTEKTINSKSWLKAAYANALQSVSRILARSQSDADYFVKLGADETKVQAVGNIKFAPSREYDNSAPPNLIGQPYWLAASTHNDEELQLAQIYIGLRHLSRLLVIAPRHPERRDAIHKQLSALGLKVSVRSHDEQITPDTDIYLADTLGELKPLMTHADLVFMGGSLVACGGHNILQPAQLGKAIVTGPYMDNFREELEYLLEEQAVIQIENGHQLEKTIEQLLSTKQQLDDLGEKAGRLMQQEQNILEAYLNHLQPYLITND